MSDPLPHTTLERPRRPIVCPIGLFQESHRAGKYLFPITRHPLSQLPTSNPLRISSRPAPYRTDSKIQSTLPRTTYAHADGSEFHLSNAPISDCSVKTRLRRQQHTLLIRILLSLFLLFATFIHTEAHKPSSPCHTAPRRLTGNRPHIGFAYYDADRLYDTVPALFYDDSDFTPRGRLRWTARRYERKIAHTAAVLDSMRMDIVALAGVENEAVVRDLVAACGEDYCYIHRTFNTFDGLDIALLYHGDRFFPDLVEQGRGWLYVEGDLPTYGFSAIPIAEARPASDAAGDCAVRPPARSAENPLTGEPAATHPSEDRLSPQGNPPRLSSGIESSWNASPSHAVSGDGPSHSEIQSDNPAPFRHAIPSGNGLARSDTHPRNRQRRLGILACNNPRYAAEAIADCRENHPDVQLIAAGRFQSEHAAQHGMRDLAAAAERSGHGNICYRNGWRMRERILSDTALFATGADAYLRRFLFDLRSGTPFATYEKTVYRGGYGSLLPVFTYLQ